MATTKFPFTNIQALQIALVMAKGNSCDDAIREVLGDTFNAEKHTPETYVRKVSHKIHVAERAKVRTKTKSRVRIANESTAKKFAATLDSGDEFTLNDIMGTCPEIRSYSKAAAIVNILAENGAIVRNGNKNGKAIYKAV